MSRPFDKDHPEQIAYDNTCSMWLTEGTNDREKYAYRDGHYAGWANATPEWKPIETAPRDKRVMVWSGHETYCAHWSQNPMTGDEAWIVAEWGIDGDQALVKPTHWLPLPLPPNVELRGARENAGKDQSRHFGRPF